MNTHNNIPDMRGIAECSKLFGISQHFCRTLALSGKVKAIRTGGANSKILVNCASMAEYFATHSLRDESEPEQLCNGVKPISVKIGR